MKREIEETRRLSNEDFQDSLGKVHNTIVLSLGDKVLREVSKETTGMGLW